MPDLPDKISQDDIEEFDMFMTLVNEPGIAPCLVRAYHKPTGEWHSLVCLTFDTDDGMIGIRPIAKMISQTEFEEYQNPDEESEER